MVRLIDMSNLYFILNKEITMICFIISLAENKFADHPLPHVFAS